MFLFFRILDLLPHIAIFFVFLLISLNLGILTLTKFTKVKSSVLHISTSIILGYIIISFYYFFIGILKIYKEPFLTVVPFFISSILFGLASEKLLAFYNELFSFKKELMITLSIVAIIVLFRAFPDIGFDSNWYHLSQPKLYLKKGELYHVGGYIFPSGYPQFTEMLYIPLLHLGNSITTSIFSLFNYVHLGLIVFASVRKLTQSTQLAVLSFIALLSTPIIFNFSNIAYVDILQGLSFTLAFCWAQSYISSNKKTDLALTGLMLTSVAGMKYAGGLYCLALTIFVLVSIKKVKTLVPLGILSAIGLVPWLIRNAIQTGNFFAPFGNVHMFHYASESENYIDYILNIDWAQTFTLLTSNAPFDYLVLFMALILVALWVINQKWQYILLTFFSFVILRILPPGDHFRFYIPFIPVVTTLFFIELSKIKKAYLAEALKIIILLFLANQLSFVLISQRPLMAYASGIKTTEQFKQHYFLQEPFMLYDIGDKVKKEVGNKKLLVKGVDLIYPTLENFAAQDYSFADLDRNEIYTFRTLREEMLRNKYEYILVNRGTLQEHFAIWFKETESDNVEKYFRLVLHESISSGKKWFLYKVK